MTDKELRIKILHIIKEDFIKNKKSISWEGMHNTTVNKLMEIIYERNKRK